MELRDPSFMYFAQPLEVRVTPSLLHHYSVISPSPCSDQDNLFEWHFTIRGPEGTEFEGGFYHGRIVLPSEYPMKPPSIILMTVSCGGSYTLLILYCLGGFASLQWFCIENVLCR